MTNSSTSTNLQLSSSAYDRLKQVVQVILPGLGSLYFALAGIWGLPNAEQVVGTCSAIALFLGLLLTLSSKNYNSPDKYDGAIEIAEDGNGKKGYSLSLNAEPESLDGKTEVRFKIDNQL